MDTILIMKSWNQSLELIETVSKLIEPLGIELKENLEKSDALFKDFGGDPCRKNRSKFRPLRLSREEDWSDWLAFFLEESNGNFIKELLGLDNTKGSEFVIEREYQVQERRADIVMTCRNKKVGIHIEVKVGDLNLDKTIETSEFMEGEFNKDCELKWTNYLLLPAEDEPSWEALKNKPGWDKVDAITWDDLSNAMRNCFVNGKEHIVWKAWAHPFIGIIEQKLLDIEPVALDKQKFSLRDLRTMVRLNKIVSR
jgi:hypothetical protein